MGGEQPGDADTDSAVGADEAAADEAAADEAPPAGPRPPSVRIAAALLSVMAGFTALSGLGTLTVVVSVIMLDPTLLDGQLGLALTAAAVVLAAGLLGVLLPVVGALSIRGGQPTGRVIGTVLGVLWLGSPLFPLGVWLLYTLWGDPQTGEWFAERADERERAAAARAVAASAARVAAEVSDNEGADAGLGADARP